MVERPQLLVAPPSGCSSWPASLSARAADGTIPARAGQDASRRARRFRRARDAQALHGEDQFRLLRDPLFSTHLQELRPQLEPARRQIVVAGIEAHVCVMQTALELLRQGNQVHLCWDCVSGRGPNIAATLSTA